MLSRSQRGSASAVSTVVVAMPVWIIHGDRS
jgi:hypothetical protein